MGAAIGFVIGLVMGYVRPIFDPAISAAQPVLWASIVESGIIGALVAGSFGRFFGFLLGRGLSEDDASLATSFKNEDATVVSVRTTPENRKQVAHILHTWRQREVENAPA